VGSKVQNASPGPGCPSALSLEIFNFFPHLHGSLLQKGLLRGSNFATLRLDTLHFHYFVLRGNLPPPSTLDRAREMTTLPSVNTQNYRHEEFHDSMDWTSPPRVPPPPPPATTPTTARRLRVAALAGQREEATSSGEYARRLGRAAADLLAERRAGPTQRGAQRR
jgi:hypothetical protein